MNIFVGCSSRVPKNIEYEELAEKVGNFIVEGKHNLVFGAYNHGLMGKVYSIVEKSLTSDVIAVTCNSYVEDLKELSYKEPAYIYDNISGRKDAFFRLADVLIFIPGGLGTLDELMTAIESKRNKEHQLPIIIINKNGFFNHFIDMLEKIYLDEFADSISKELYMIVDDFEGAVSILKALN